MTLELVIAFLVIVMAAQQIYFLRQIQVLVNKVMSGSYQGYVKTESPTAIRLKIDDTLNEDLGTLNDIS